MSKGRSASCNEKRIKLYMNNESLPVHLGCNAIIFIESLDDDRTTKEILTNIKYYLPDERLRLIYFSIDTRTELVNVLTQILNNKTLFPIIHFATHGDVEGIKLRQEFVQWKYILPILQMINFRMKNTLAIIMALCFGLHAIGGIQENERAPFALLLGPQNEILENTLDELLKVFYVHLLKSENINVAINEMFIANNKEKIPILILTPHLLIIELMKHLKNNIKSGKARHNLMKAYFDTNGKKMTYELKGEIQTEEDIVNLYTSQWDKRISKYLMLDINPQMSNLTFIPNFKKFYYENEQS